MRVRILANGGAGNAGLDSTGGTLNGPLILSHHPSVGMEAATKGYVDTSVTSLNASNITSGTISVSMLPAMTGDLSKPAGSGVLTLAANGVTAGTYPKVVVNAKGLVTGGTSLVESDIPALDWNKIGSGKPTTLNGYGVTDALNVNGGTLTGALTLNANPSLAMHAATKGYIDSALSSNTGLGVGDIVRKPYSTTPTGFLKCNGAYVSKTTYSALFAVIGNSYDVANPSPSTQFMVPDYSALDATYIPGVYSYIKI